MPRGAASVRGLVFYGPLLAAIQGAAREPLTFTVLDIANRLTAGGAAISAPGCAVRLRAVRSSLADHIREKKKSFCCVTTRRRNLWTFNGLGCSLGPLTALAFYLGMPDFGLGILAVFGLSPRRLPAANLSPAFRLLAISLVPAPRLVLVATPFAHAAPWTRSTSSGRALRLSLIVESAHGRLDLPRETLEENVTAFSSGNSKTRTR